MLGVKEIAEEFSRQEEVRDQIKDIVSAISAKTKVPKPMIRKVARLYFKKAGAAFEAETSEIQNLYKALAPKPKA